MDYREQLEEQKIKRLSWISEDLRDIKNSFTQFLKFGNTTVELPLDYNGEIWTGKESRYVLADEPMENCRFMDGLLWDGHRWFIFSHSADGSNWSIVECTEAKHYKPKISE